MPKPELGTLHVGDPLIVVPTGKFGFSGGPHDVVVTKVGRVWVEMGTQLGAYPRTYRMRMDTQDPGGAYSPSEVFRTPAQHEWEMREKAASGFLRGAGITTEHSGRYSGDRVTLANLIRRHEGLDDL